ncbi:MAG TPA: aminotransferase class I/II-fold pyridoxal phosphate-dependent enzyme [Candidatus Deferrimicrobium sp.]|nr:aminotransferase class I/II-fold pyridoxal phosphate-dependent enzyme [Candidatus Deferrimicrobium sp.]
MMPENFVEKELDDLGALVAAKVKSPGTAVMVFVDATAFLSDLLKAFYKPGSSLIAAGHVTPEVQLAAHRADIGLMETLGVSPFSADPEAAAAAVRSPQDIIYVANPNRVTGANFSLPDLQLLAQAVPQGMLIVDEHYFDYLGITGVPLVELLTNVVILRSFAASPAITSHDIGYVITGPETVNTVRECLPSKPISSMVRQTVAVTCTDGEALVDHLRQTHEESLRLALALSKLNVQSRLTATDFLLLRVADTKLAGNFLARYKVPIDNLDGYPLLENYLRYRVQAGHVNDRLIEAFAKMPPDFYVTRSVDRRATTLRARSQGTSSVALTETGAGVTEASPAVTRPTSATRYAALTAGSRNRPQAPLSEGMTRRPAAVPGRTRVKSNSTKQTTR